jgi:glycosyltransferase involved in cell wall biosynthesis
MLLTIGMMVKNEGKHLEECLEALSLIREALDSELIIIDTGSDDNTVEIAKKFTENVYFHEWNEHFSEMRNKVISYSKGDWYFSLDGDEIVSNPETIINFFKSGKYKKYKTAFVTQKNYTDEKNENFTKILVPRLFENDEDFHFEGAVHNQPQFKKPIYGLSTVLDHYGYISSDKELMEKKFQRTATILKRELEKDPENIYYWYQLSRSYAMHGDNGEALDAILKAYNIMKDKNKNSKLKNYMNIYTQLAKIYMRNNRYGKAEEISKEALNIKKGYIDLNYYLAGARLNLNKNEKSLDNFKKYIKLVENYEHTESKKDIRVDDETISSIEIAYKYVLILANNLNKDQQYAIKKGFLIEKEKHLVEILTPFIEICLNNKEYLSLKTFFEKKVSHISHLKYKFIQILESKRMTLDTDEEKELSEVLSNLKDDVDYFLLNRIRLRLLREEKFDLSSNIFDNIDFNKKPNYFGDMIYYLLINNNLNDEDKFEILTSISEKNINGFIEFLNKKYDNLKDVLLIFINNNIEMKDIAKIRIKKMFGRYLIALTDITKDTNYIIDKYLEVGTRYITRVYNKEIIEDELIYELKSKEEAFLLYIYKAFAVKDNNLKAYIKYLRKAIDIYPLMKKVVETLLLEVKEEQDKVNEELEAEKDKFKANIEELINQGKLNEAENLIEEYQNIFKSDDEIYSMLGVIEIIKENFERARSILDRGLRKTGNNFDLLFNLGYSYEQLNEYQKANETYLKAKEIAKLEEQKNEIEESLARIKKYDNKDNDRSDEINKFIYNNKLKKPKIFKKIENGNITEDDIIKNWDDDYPLVSINCIAYNHENFIKDSLNSFLMQKTSFPFEIIVHDDASKDNTAEIIKEYEERFPNIIKGIYQEENIYSKNQKPFRITNSMSNGKYIALCDGDDFWLDQNKLKKQIGFLEKNNDYALSGLDAVIIDSKYNIIKNSKLDNKFKRNYSKEEMRNNNGYSLTMNMVFRNILDKLPQEYDLVQNEDRFLFSLLGNYGKYKFHKNIIPSVYMVHNKSVWSSQNLEKKSISEMNTWFQLYKYYKRKDKLKISNNYWKTFVNAVLKINKRFY